MWKHKDMSDSGWPDAGSDWLIGYQLLFGARTRTLCARMSHSHARDITLSHALGYRAVIVDQFCTVYHVDNITPKPSLQLALMTRFLVDTSTGSATSVLGIFRNHRIMMKDWKRQTNGKKEKTGTCTLYNVPDEKKGDIGVEWWQVGRDTVYGLIADQVWQ